MKITLLASFFLPVFVFSQTNISQKFALNGSVSESSGLIFHNNRLITHNDSGNTAQLFEMDTISGNILRTITISNTTNTDWEDLAQDEDYIYIGDFGNNNGNRTDLKVYRVLKSEYDANTSVNADVINFSFEDQTDFTSSPNNNDWDAEALIAYNNQLWVFTKQWVSGQTVAYRMPKAPGSHSAVNSGSLNVQGLITGADFNIATGTIYMTGYSNTLQPFIYSLKGFTGNAVFGGTNVKTTFSSTDIGGIAQIEGIAAVDANRYLFSSESFSTTTPVPISVDAKLFGFNTNDNVLSNGNPKQKALIIYPNPVKNKLIFLNGDNQVTQLEIFSSSGLLLLSKGVLNREIHEIDVSGLRPGLYFVRANNQSGHSVKTFVKN